MSDSPKKNRIDRQVSQDLKEVLEPAASINGLSLSSYLQENCLASAQKDTAENQQLVLSDRDRDLFLSLIENPPQPNQNLVAAMQEFQQQGYS